jgi:hypothetical protein
MACRGASNPLAKVDGTVSGRSDLTNCLPRSTPKAKITDTPIKPAMVSSTA